MAQQMQHYPGVEILVEAFLKFEFLRPFAVVAFVLHVDAGLGDIEFIEGLHRLEFDVSGAAEPGCDYILGHLSVRTGGDPDGSFEVTTVSGHGKRVFFAGMEKQIFVNCEDLVGFVIFFENPGAEVLD
jgi:hypothetical protein